MMIKISNTTSQEAELFDALAGDAEVTPLMVFHGSVQYLVRPDTYSHLRTIVSWNQLVKVVEIYEGLVEAAKHMPSPPDFEILWEDMHNGKLFV